MLVSHDSSLGKTSYKILFKHGYRIYEWMGLTLQHAKMEHG
jgi:hypothetical protein